MSKINFSSQLLLFSALLFCFFLKNFAEDADSIVFLDNSSHPHTVREIDTRREQEDEEQTCYSDDIRGKCVEILYCPPALKSVRQQKRHDYQRCGFHGIIEVICCPIDFIVETTTKPFGSWTVNSTDSTTKSSTTVRDKYQPNDSKSRLNNRKSVQVCDEYSNEIKPDLTFHIIEGQDAEPKEFPHMVALGYNSDTIGVLTWGCGASLISRNYVLTAAHCIINADQNPPIKARMGMLKLDENPKEGGHVQEFDIVNITIHPEYKKWDKLNDIALIKLNKRVSYSDYVHPACLYTQENDPSGMVVTGWGDTEIAGESSNTLQKARLTAVPLNECNVTYLTRASKSVLSSQICAADNKSDTCQGDSGGPLQVQNIANSSVYSIVGVTSYGIGCGSKYPGIYTRVSSYLDWIEGIVWGDS